MPPARLPRRIRGPTCKPGSVPCRGTAATIYLASRLPDWSSDLPESHNGPDQPCPHIRSCSRWGLPSQPVSRLLVGSYIKGPRPPTISPLPDPALRRAIGGMLSVALSLSFASPVGETRTVGVTHHRVLRSPDFPLPQSEAGRPRPIAAAAAAQSARNPPLL